MFSKKNRKKYSSVTVIPFKLLTILIATGAIALAYLWLLDRCDVLGRQIKRLEERKQEVHKRVLNEELQLASMKTPQNMERLLTQFGLNMSLPEPGRVVLIRGREETRTILVAETRSKRTAWRPLIHD